MGPASVRIAGIFLGPGGIYIEEISHFSQIHKFKDLEYLQVLDS